MSTPEITHLSVGQMDNNAYILTDPLTGQRVLIDPADQANRILAALGTPPTLAYILLTHGDADHWQALDAVREATGAPVGIHRADEGRLEGRSVDFHIDEGDRIRFGEVTLDVFHTPGHTGGGICFYTAPYLFDGDTLFPGGPGNTRREGGDFDLIMRNVQEKLFALPDETIVYPGHGKSTTIGAERPHIQQWLDRRY